MGSDSQVLAIWRVLQILNPLLADLLLISLLGLVLVPLSTQGIDPESTVTHTNSDLGAVWADINGSSHGAVGSLLGLWINSDLVTLDVLVELHTEELNVSLHIPQSQS